MSRVCFGIFVFVCFIIDDVKGRSKSNAKFEVNLENMTDCQNPLPPYTEDRMIIVDCEIHRNKGRTYLSGRNIVLYEVPFQNFSISTYMIDDSGRRELKLQIQKLNCRSFFSRMFLEYGNFRYVKNNCQLLKGFFPIRDFDIGKALHGVPNLHSAGRLLHRVALTLKGKKTILCIELTVSVKECGSK